MWAITGWPSPSQVTNSRWRPWQCSAQESDSSRSLRSSRSRLFLDELRRERKPPFCGTPFADTTKDLAKEGSLWMGAGLAPDLHRQAKRLATQGRLAAHRPHSGPGKADEILARPSMRDEIEKLHELTARWTNCRCGPAFRGRVETSGRWAAPRGSLSQIGRNIRRTPSERGLVRNDH